jgi:hypothetical protein
MERAAAGRCVCVCVCVCVCTLKRMGAGGRAGQKPSDDIASKQAVSGFEGFRGTSRCTVLL